VVHCHADHFEPEGVAKELGASADVALWLERCKPAVPTLFVKCPIGFHLDRDWLLGMRLYTGSTSVIEADYLGELVELGVGIGLHVHHEAWTYNTLTKLSPGQRELHDYVVAENDPKMDHARMVAMVKTSLSWLRDATGLPLETWGFVHGCWAFGASDPEICQLETEIPLLYSLGCRGDFSFPAGRRYCDPTWDRPKWVRPVEGRRAYELPRARVRDRHIDGRMLVWASRCDDWWLGLDTYSRDSRKLTESPDKLERYLEMCPVIDGTAYIKTCGHGMNAYYWQGEPVSTVGAFAADLAEKCAAAGVPVEFLTTDQVTQELIASRPAA
jgi:hypothetical protein